ncbi:DUF3152 domain-containing protein [Streptomyces sp. DH24]|uniref:DUF3152 domain-containing protein n=1 Tax=Streptomyces sp. DH24 TaxID=3040123 RepID=UPI002442BB14|nr:DUF3152 domain-containing protein [Streptomyces sp. DH24]MDG9716669.1 DUF3152 domain-containing protein [Streptomyces sp. DH24]
MGRHSRRGPAPKGAAADTTGTRKGRPPAADTAPARPAPSTQGGLWLPDGTPARGVPRVPDAAPPAQGAPGPADGTWRQGGPWLPDGMPAHGVPRFSDGTPAQGVPRFADGTPAHGVPRFSDGTPAQGVPRFADGTPAHGVPRFPDGTPAHGVPQARGGHPEQREAGGGWGDLSGRIGAGHGVPGVPGAPGPGVPIPRQRQAPPAGPRPEYLDAFDEDDDVFAPPVSRAHRSPADGDTTDPHTLRTDADDDDAPPTGEPAQNRGGKGRTFTGIAAAAVTTVLAVVVAGQVTDGADGADSPTQSAAEQSRDTDDSASRGDARPAPSDAAPAPLTYAQKMARTYPLGAELKGSGKFEAIPGVDKAPGKGQKYTYRVDVEKGLGLDGALFAQAVQKTLNDDRSWAHNGARTFERVYSGEVDFVITLASPGTTADWCAKSGLDTTVDNVSCDSAATQRVMINAYRWAQGSETYGDDIHAYRQMLINHEIGHRLGYGHVTCDKNGDLAPVMQQQTKFLEYNGIRCLPNAWPYPVR